MREIKFRAWDNEDKKYLFNIGVNPCMEQICSDGLWADDWDEYEIEQHTGLKDKNGKEIYEGDICKSDYGEIGKIVFQNGKFIWTDGYCIWDIISEKYYNALYNVNIKMVKDIRIIGNIHENPELLENK